MSIDIVIVKEDFQTIVPGLEILDSIEADKDFFHMREIADKMGLFFLSTIDPAGYTIINSLQIRPIKQEIQQLRKCSDVNQKLLDTIDKAINLITNKSAYYVKFIGD